MGMILGLPINGQVYQEFYNEVKNRKVGLPGFRKFFVARKGNMER